MNKRKQPENRLMTVAITKEQHKTLMAIKAKTLLPIKAQLAKAIDWWADKNLTP